MSFELEMHKRLRRCAGIFDDEVEVRIEEEVSSYSGGCETCDYGASGGYSIYVSFYSYNDMGRLSYIGSQSYMDMGQMIREMDQVDLSA